MDFCNNCEGTEQLSGKLKFRFDDRCLSYSESTYGILRCARRRERFHFLFFPDAAKPRGEDTKMPDTGGIEEIMGRREQREQIFKLLFRVEFNPKEEMPEQCQLFLRMRKMA